MRIILHFTAANHVSDHLQEIAREIDQGRTFGAGWCLIIGEKCPVSPNNRAGLPCKGNLSLCQNSEPVDRTSLPVGRPKA